MTLATCPKCDEQVTLPAVADHEAKVRCPLCQEEYLLGDVLDRLPPMLVLLDAPVAPEPIAAGPESVETEPFGDGVFGATDMEDDDFSTFVESAEDDADEPAPFDFAGSASEDGEEASPARRARPAPRKKKSSPMKELIKIVLGGVVALPTTQLILWWLPGDWARDPFDLAPKLPPYVSFLAPEKLRSPGSTDSNEPPGGGSLLASANDDDNEPFDSGLRMDGDDTPDAGGDEPGTGGDEPGTGGNEPDTGGDADDSLEDFAPDTGGIDPFAFDPTAEDTEPAMPTDEPAMPADEPAQPADDVALPATDDAALPTDDAAPPATDDPAEVPLGDAADGVVDAPKVAQDAVNATASAAAEAAQAWKDAAGAERAVRLKAAKAFYGAFCELGRASAFAAQADVKTPAANETVAGLLAEVGKAKINPALVARFGGLQLGGENETGQGIFLAGVVQEIRPSGQMFELFLEISGKTPRTVSIITPFDPADNPRSTCAAGDSVLVLGAVVPDAMLNLIGYDGEEDTVVWGGQTAVLPKTE